MSGGLERERGRAIVNLEGGMRGQKRKGVFRTASWNGRRSEESERECVLRIAFEWLKGRKRDL